MKHIAIDSNILIYSFEGTAFYRKTLLTFFGEVKKQRVHLSCSTVVWSEILVLPFKDMLQDTISRYSALDEKPFFIAFTPVNKAIAIRAAAIHARYGFKTPDAIHLATAMANNVDYFLTNDTRLNNFSELPIKSLKK